MLGGKSKGWWEIDAYHLNWKERCSALVLSRHSRRAYGLYRMILTEKQQEKVDKKNRVNYNDKRRIDKLRVEPKSAVSLIERRLNALFHTKAICFDAAMCLCLEI